MNLHRLSSLIFCIALAAMPAWSQAPAPTEGELEYRGWCTLNGDLDYLSDFVARAKAAGMNRIQLSHGVVQPQVEAMLGGPRADEITGRVNAVCKQAHEAGIKVDMWVNELSSAPKEMMDGNRIRLDAAYWKWLEGKYDKVFAKVPGVDGLVVTAWETRYAVINDSAVVSEKPPAERVAELAACFGRIAEKHDKQLIFRTFTYQPEQLAAMREGLIMAAEKSPQLKDRLWVMLKCVPADWMPYYPFNPALGNVGGLRQIVELDLGAEFSGQSVIPFEEVDYVKRVLDYGRSKGVQGAVARIDRFGNSALGTPNEVNVRAYSMLVKLPSLDTEPMLRNWAIEKYGAAAAVYVVRALERSFDINNIINCPLGEWVTNHSRLPGWQHAVGALEGWSLSHWIDSPATERSRDQFLHPTAALLTRLAEEKAAARRLCQESLDDVLQTRVILSASDYSELRGYFERMAVAIDAQDHAQQALFAAWRMQGLPQVKPGNYSPEQSVQAEELMILRYQVLAQLAALGRMADQIEARYGADFLPARPADIRALRDDLVKRLQLEASVAQRTLRFSATTPEAAAAWQADLRARLFDLLKMSDLVKRNPPVPFDAKVVGETDEGTWTLKQIQINSTQTRRMDVLLGLPKTVQGRVPAVVCIGGHGSSQFSPYDPDPASLYTGFAAALSREGYVTISALVSQHQVYEPGRTLMGERLWDLMRSVDYLETMKEVDKDRIGCGGLSLGGEMTMWLAAMDPRMQASVSCGFLTLMDQLEQNHCLCWKFPGEREIVDFPDIYAMTAPRWLACQNGLRENTWFFYVPLARYALTEVQPAYRVFGVPDRVELHPHDGAHVIDTPALVEYMKAHL